MPRYIRAAFLCLIAVISIAFLSFDTRAPVSETERPASLASGKDELSLPNQNLGSFGMRHSEETPGSIRQDSVSGRLNDSFIAGVASLTCEQPVLSIDAVAAYWNSYSDYLIRNLSIEVSIHNDAGHTAYNAKYIGTVASGNVIGKTAMPITIGDLAGDSSHSEILNYSVPQGVSRFRLTVYASAQDACGGTYEYPTPYAEANPDGTTTGSATAIAGSDTTINISMPYTGDNNQNNIYVVQYRRSVDENWSEWGTNPKDHNASPFNDQITGLIPGESYDVKLTYIDTEGVFGASPQTVAGIVLPVYQPAAPTIGAASALTATSIRWSFTDNAVDENGFRLHNNGHADRTEVDSPNLGYLDETGLAPNTRYTRHVHAYNSAGNSVASANASRYTLAAGPNVTASKAISTWSSSDNVVFTNAAGFGSGGVEYYRYTFDQSPTHTFTGAESQWSSGNLTRTMNSSGAWYLHVRSYNGDGVANGSANYGPYLYDGTAPSVSTFTATTPSTSLGIPITAFSASDDIGVSGYQVTSSATPPAADGGGWTGSAPSTFMVAGDGTYELYPWVRDAAGNVSAVSTAPKTVIVDTESPTVNSTTPANGSTGVTLNTNVTINFSESVNCSTVNTNNLTISSGGWSLTSCSGSQAVFATSAQTRSTPYTVTVSKSVKDVNGNPLQSIHQFSYSTVAVPETFTVCAAGCDFTTIQGAISDTGTVDGDTIIVSDGTYSENIDFNGKGITVESINGADSTIIQGNGANAPVVTFNNGETSAGVLDGFTIDNQAVAGSVTRGIYINGASPTISNCSVQGNTTGSNKNGAGIFVSGVAGSITVSNTKVTGNSSGGLGGGVYIGGGARMNFSHGDINGNQANTLSGGGIAVIGADSTLDISRSNIKGNQASRFGGGLYSTAIATVTNCTISGNITTESFDGGGIYNNATLNVMNSTVAGNYSARNGGGIRHDSGTAIITNSIIWGNSALGTGPNISGTPAITYSDVEGGFTGNGNIDVNPAFYLLDPAAADAPVLSGDYRIQINSSVIDVGTTTGAPVDDIEGDARPYGPGIDMGSDENDNTLIVIVPGWP